MRYLLLCQKSKRNDGTGLKYIQTNGPLDKNKLNSGGIFLKKERIFCQFKHILNQRSDGLKNNPGDRANPATVSLGFLNGFMVISVSGRPEN